MATQKLRYIIEIDSDTEGAAQAEAALERVEKQAKTAGDSLRTGIGIAIGERLVSGIESIPSILFAAAQRGWEFNATLEAGEVKFRTLLGSAEAARDRMKELARFAAETPFQLNELVQASTVLQTLTKGALSTGDGLRLVGDAAATAGVPVAELSTHIGRLYDGLMNGRPVGESMMRLQELGLISSDTRAKIEELQKQGQQGEVVWKTASDELGKYSGQMQQLSQTANGLMSTLADNIDAALGTAMKQAFDESKGGIEGIIAALNDPATIDRLTEIAKEIGVLTEGLLALGSSGFDGLMLLQERMDMLGESVGHFSMGEPAEGLKSLWSFLSEISTGGKIGRGLAAVVSELDGTADALEASGAAADAAARKLNETQEAADELASAEKEAADQMEAIGIKAKELQAALDKQAADRLTASLNETNAAMAELLKDWEKYGDATTQAQRAIVQANAEYQKRVALIREMEDAAGAEDALRAAAEVRDAKIAAANERIANAKERAAAAEKDAADKRRSEQELRVELQVAELRAQGQERLADALERELEVRRQIREVAERTGRSEAEAEAFVRRRQAALDAIAAREGQGAAAGNTASTAASQVEESNLSLIERARQGKSSFSRTGAASVGMSPGWMDDLEDRYNGRGRYAPASSLLAGTLAAATPAAAETPAAPAAAAQPTPGADTSRLSASVSKAGTDTAAAVHALGKQMESSLTSIKQELEDVNSRLKDSRN